MTLSFKTSPPALLKVTVLSELGGCSLTELSVVRTHTELIFKIIIWQKAINNILRCSEISANETDAAAMRMQGMTTEEKGDCAELCSYHGVMRNRGVTRGTKKGEGAGLYETRPSANLALSTQENVTLETWAGHLHVNYLIYIHFNVVVTKRPDENLPHAMLQNGSTGFFLSLLSHASHK